jgi:hypothetical protein
MFFPSEVYHDLENLHGIYRVVSRWNIQSNLHEVSYGYFPAMSFYATLHSSRCRVLQQP